MLYQVKDTTRSTIKKDGQKEQNEEAEDGNSVDFDRKRRKKEDEEQTEIEEDEEEEEEEEEPPNKGNAPDSNLFMEPNIQQMVMNKHNAPYSNMFMAPTIHHMITNKGKAPTTQQYSNMFMAPNAVQMNKGKAPAPEYSNQFNNLPGAQHSDLFKKLVHINKDNAQNDSNQFNSLPDIQEHFNHMQKPAPVQQIKLREPAIRHSDMFKLVAAAQQQINKGKEPAIAEEDESNQFKVKEPLPRPRHTNYKGNFPLPQHTITNEKGDFSPEQHAITNEEGKEAERIDVEESETLVKIADEVASLQNRNNRLIKQVKANIRSKHPHRMKKNVRLLYEINTNIAKVLSLYSRLSTDFSNILESQRRLEKAPEEEEEKLELNLNLSL